MEKAEKRTGWIWAAFNAMAALVAIAAGNFLAAALSITVCVMLCLYMFKQK